MKVLVTTIPGLGHLHPMVPLCKALRAAGHEVSVATSPAFIPVVEAVGLDGVGAGPAWTGEETDQFLGLPTPGQSRMREFVGLAEPFGDDLLRFAEQWHPDVIVHDHMELGGWMVGERRNVPHVPFSQTAVRILEPSMQQVLGIVDGIRSLRYHFGLPPDDDQTLATRWLYLDASPMWSAAPLVPPGPTVRQIRCVNDDRSGGETLPGWIDDLGDRPLVYVTMGTVFNQIDGLVATVAAGAAAVDAEVLVTVGRNHDPAALGALPANVHVERYVPQTLLLDRCAAVVCHGGSGTVFGSLAAGVPLVVVPIGGDQPFNAFLVGEHGFGATCTTGHPDGAPFPAAVPSELRSEQITDALTVVLADDRYRDAAQRAAAEIAAQPPVEHAVALIERIVATGEPIGAADVP